MIPDSLYRVSRDEYRGFIETIKPDCRQVEIINISEWSTATKTFSKKTGKCLCSRIEYKPFGDKNECRPETYYIFEMPDPDERQAPIPKRRIYLNSPQEVQTFFNLLNKLQKEGKD